MESSLHGQRVSIAKVADLDCLNINRGNFLDHELVKQVNDKIAVGADMLFIGNDVAETRKKQNYLLIIHGMLPCGSKTTLTITGIKPYVDVRVKKDETEAECEARMKRFVNFIDDDNASIAAIEIKTGKDFLYYDHEEHLYARVHFNSLKIRADFMAVCQERDVKTYSNDKSAYFRVVAREYEINLSGWNIIRNYTKDYHSDSKAKYTFTIDIKDIEPIADEQALNVTARAYDIDPAVVKYERMIISSFDIEMIPAKPDRFPDADKNPNDSIFMICMTYHFVKRNDSILSVCLTLKETDPLEGVFMVHCRSEGCLLWAFAHFMKMMQPDFITEFNGGGFDWRNIITKAAHLNVLSFFLEDMSIVKLQHWEKSPSMLSRFHRETRIKINGATADSISKGLKMQGFVPFDTLVVFKQLEPNADSHKLNECLKRCNLGSKDDMDIQEMFRIYREGTKTEMRLVAHYCFIDTFKLQQLLLKKNVVQDRREVANLSYTSLNDNFCFAGGSRMRNLLMNRGSKLGYFFDTQYRPEIEDPDAKFPGAYVVPPIKGIVKPMMRIDEFADLNKISYDEKMLKKGYKFIEKNFERMYHSDDTVKSKYPFIQAYNEYVNTTKNQYPISGLDFASLYPSIIMTYNISPEKLIIDEDYANELKAQGRDIQFVSFPFCGKIMKAWFVRHKNVQEDYSICGKLLIELFARRAAIKKVLKHLGEKIFEMEMEMKAYPRIEDYPRFDEYNEVKFDHICADSKQKAVKVFMNTLYGEMGNFLSCICAVQVAGSVTTMGRANLRLIKTFVEDEIKMKVYYGDSVVGDTPIMIKRGGKKELIPIEELDDRYEHYVGFKECIDYTNENVYVMTEDGYSKIVKVIRHCTRKKLYRVTTHIGSVIVTEDHSLLNANKEKIKPLECAAGTSLLHWQQKSIDIDQLLANLSVIDEEIKDLATDDIPNHLAYVKGFFFGDGSCGRYTCANGQKKATLALNNQNLVFLGKCVEIFNYHHDDVKLKIIDTLASSGVYKAVAVGNVLPLVIKWRKEFYSSRKHKKVPQNILNGDRHAKLAFMQGYYAADGDKTYKRLSNKGQIGTQGLYLLLQDLGYNISVNVRPDKELIYRLTFTHGKQRCKDITAIKSIEELGTCDGYVYDLETESHHFAAGVGQLVVHNTDSLYVACNPSHFIKHDREYFTGKIDKLAYGTNIVEETFAQIEIVKDLVNEHLIKDNGSTFLKMAYEEVLYPAAFLSKKKYYGVPHEENVDFYPRKLFLRGLEVVKRGASDVLKDVINEVLREVMDLKTTRDIIDIIKEAIARVFNTNWPIDAFAKTKVYRPDKKNVSVLKMMARYRANNYPTIPEPNVRFKYIICKYYPWSYDSQGRQTKNTIGDCMELVERVHDEGLEIDLEYYFDNELTGQLARLITFCKEFKDVAQVSTEIDESTMSEIEIDAILKENYNRSEDALFKAAKKFIGQLAKHYSKAYVNKRSLFTDTWREVCGFIEARADIRSKHMPMPVAIVLSIFVKSTTTLDQNLDQYLFDWASLYIAKKYQTIITSEQKVILKKKITRVSKYIVDHDLKNALTNSAMIWREQVVQYIRREYDYELICKNNLPYETLWDVLTRQELEAILSYHELFPSFTADQAMDIIDLISEAIGETLPLSQFDDY